MGLITQTANLAQKGAVLGLISLLGYHVYQITSNVYQDQVVDKETSHQKVMAKIGKVVEEESKNRNSIDKIPDRYDRDDDSYLKRVPDLSDVAKRS